MLEASLSLAPVVLVRLLRSDPAKSIIESLLYLINDVS